MASPSLATLAGFQQNVVVGMGDMAVSNNHAAVLATYSLGSCIGITIYDPVSQVGGLLHLMLPDSSLNIAKANRQPGMFADTGIPALFRAAYQMKADKFRVQICVAGGAQIMDSSGFFNIGKRNVECVTSLLGKHGLRIQAAQVGGLVSRTLSLHLGTGEVHLKVSGSKDNVVMYAGA